MKRGRPPLEPRITELEKRVETLLHMLEEVKSMLERQKPKEYEPRFDHWPSLR